MINLDDMTTTGVIIACTIYVLKSMWDTFIKRNGKKEGCVMTSADNLLIKQTHGISVENNKLLLRHYDEVSNIAASIKHLAESISDCRNEDSKTQRQQTQILERMTDILSNQ